MVASDGIKYANNHCLCKNLRKDGGIKMSENINELTTFTEGKVLVMERIFNAPRSLVFEAFSDSERLESWWGPKGWKTINRQFEFKPEGVWLSIMR